MTDVALEWHSDFMLDSKGGLLLVDGDDAVRQRLERRLFTATQSYVWHQDYGAGLPQKIGSILSVNEIKSVVASQLNLESTVALNPPAQLAVAALPNNPGSFVISIQYWDAKTGRSVSFTITS